MVHSSDELIVSIILLFQTDEGSGFDFKHWEKVLGVDECNIWLTIHKTIQFRIAIDISDFENLGTLGKGAFGTVDKVIYKKTGQTMALKV